MKDQNTPTNTLDSEWLEEIIQCVYNNGKMSEWKLSETNSSDILPWLMNEQAIAKIKEHIEALVAQAVNKANEEAEYWRKRAARWKKEVEELDGKLMDIELNRDETHMEGNEDEA